MLSLKAFLGLDASGFEVGIKRAQSVSDRFARSVQAGVRGRLQGLFSVSAATMATKSVLDLGSAIADMSSRADISTDAMQQWSFALKQNGAQAEDAISFFEKLAAARDAALSGDRKKMDAFGAFGVTKDDLKNKRLEDLGLQIGNAVKSGDAQQLIGKLRELGGKGAGALVTAFKAGLGDLFAEAPIISAKEIEGLDRAGDKIEKLGLKIKVFLAPIITFVVEQLERMGDLFGILAVAPTFIKDILSGKGAAESRKIAQDTYEEIIKGFESRQKAAETAKTGGGKGDDWKPDAYKSKFGMGGGEFFKEKTLEARETQGGQGLNINALQQMGAYIGYTPMASEIKLNTDALKRVGLTLKEFQNELKRTKHAPEGFTGNSVQY